MYATVVTIRLDLHNYCAQRLTLTFTEPPAAPADILQITQPLTALIDSLLHAKGQHVDEALASCIQNDVKKEDLQKLFDTYTKFIENGKKSTFIRQSA